MAELRNKLVAPVYSDLLDWVKFWPEARMPLLDFWARGNFVRILDSLQRDKQSFKLYISISNLNDLSRMMRRFAILADHIMIGWKGTISRPGLVIVPLAGDYVGPGGFGYTAALGSKFKEKRGGKTWYPSMGRAQILPDQVGKFYFEDCYDFLKNGRISISPGLLIGCEHPNFSLTDQFFSEVIDSDPIIHRNEIKPKNAIQTAINLNLPYLDNISLSDLWKLMNDEYDSFLRFRSAISSALIRIERSGGKENLENEIRIIQNEIIDDAVAELNIKYKKIIKSRWAMAIQAILTSTGVILGANFGLSPSELYPASAAALVRLFQLWKNIFGQEHSLRKTPSFFYWKLKNIKKRIGIKYQTTIRQDEEFDIKDINTNELKVSHWLAPSEPGLLYLAVKK